MNDRTSCSYGQKGVKTSGQMTKKKCSGFQVNYNSLIEAHKCTKNAHSRKVEKGTQTSTKKTLPLTHSFLVQNPVIRYPPLLVSWMPRPLRATTSRSRRSRLRQLLRQRRRPAVAKRYGKPWRWCECCGNSHKNIQNQKCMKLCLGFWIRFDELEVVSDRKTVQLDGSFNSRNRRWW